MSDTVGARVKRILEETGRSARELSITIGSSKGWIQTVVDGLSLNPEAERLRKLADETGYNFVWLASGRGSPKGDATVAPVERYSAMDAARAMGRAAGYDEDFVASFDVLLDADDQPDPDYLWTLMKAAWAKHRRKAAPSGGDPFAGLEERPVWPAPKKR